MIVCIAEKPSVARDIASILGARHRYTQGGVGYLEGNGYQVTWTFGHLCTLKEPQDYNPLWKQWSVSSLPIIPERFGIKPIETDIYLKQLEVIKQLMKTATMVVNCGDAGQEGELIQRWVLQYSGCTAPVKRLWISSLTDEAIKEGFASLREASDYQTLYEAGLARAVGDWLLGMNATRLYTSLYRSSGGVLSIGRVQTPTLSLIVQRQREIEHFVPEIYWELKTIYRDITFSAEKSKFSNKAEAENAYTNIEDLPFEITSVKKKGGKELPPRLFDLTSLQVACNKKFAMSAEETLQTVQSLYEKKLVTYPRVDTTYLSDDIYPKVADILIGLVSYRSLTSSLLIDPSKLRKSKKVFDNTKVTDHHAIIPTGQPNHNLSDKEQKVFDLLTRHFIACFYPDCEISTTTVQGKAGIVGFKTTGKEILSPGWRVVFEENSKGEGNSESKEDEESGQVLPLFVVGERGEHKPSLKEKQTQPPKHYTEATLLRAMETAGKLVEHEELREVMKENGIGRPSTRANIIETLFRRGYVIKERQSLRATDLGCMLIDTLKTEVLKSAELTGQWEYKLRQIERKELEVSEFLKELKALVQNIINDTLTPPSSQGPAQSLTYPNAPICPNCGLGNVIRGKQSYGCSNYHNGCTYRLSFTDYEVQFPHI